MRAEASAGAAFQTRPCAGLIPARRPSGESASGNRRPFLHGVKILTPRVRFGYSRSVSVGSFSHSIPRRFSFSTKVVRFMPSICAARILLPPDFASD